MATCAPNELLAEGACFDCLTDHQLLVAIAVLECQRVQQGDPMATCNPNELLAEGACLGCLTNHQLLRVIAQLLCNGGGGNTGDRQVYNGSGDPNGSVTPSNVNISNLYYNEDVPGEIWYWDTNSETWY